MDIRCSVCGEPWDAYGAKNGDMAAWEYELFKQGAGCPCCEGMVDEDKRFHPETIEDVENGDEDPMERINAYEAANSKNPPKWIRPEPQVIWECDGCGVQVRINLEASTVHTDSLEYYLPPKSKGASWYHQHNYEDEAPEKPAHVFKDDRKVCEHCLDRCQRCSAPISQYLEFSDTYEDGNYFNADAYGLNYPLCIDCFEKTCSECGKFSDDCKCKHEDAETKYINEEED